MRFGTRELVFLLLLLAMPVAAYLFVFQPRHAQLEEARAEILVKQDKLEQLDRETEGRPSLGQDIDRLAEAIEMFETKLPAQREVEVILEEVWQLATSRDLAVRSVRTQRWKYIRHFSNERRVVLPNIDNSLSKLLLYDHGLADMEPPEEELFDLYLDPQERCNRREDARCADVLARMRERLETWMRETNDPLLAGDLPVCDGLITADRTAYNPGGTN